MSQEKQQSSENLEKIVVALLLFLALLGRFALAGLMRIKFSNVDWVLGLISIVLLCVGLVCWPMFQFTGHFWINYFICFIPLLFLILSLMGFSPLVKHIKMQNALNFAGLKNTHGSKPKLCKIIQIDDNRMKLLVSATGIGPDRFSAKKNDLEGAFKQKIEEIKFSKNMDFIEISLCSRELPTMIPYAEVENQGQKESSFLLGESLSGGFLTQDITSLPHLLIGGATGGGKSVFFKSTILNLLKTTPHIQMYLIDLKKGVEVKEFADLPNVKIAKDENEAVKMLTAVKMEMDRRYTYLEKESSQKKIIPTKDKKDLIVLGIDEASVLYGKTTSSKSRKELTIKARELTDDLAKLARAAGIHLIIATQKPIKDSIDTKTLENLPGRVSFKMSTHAGSTSMLGNAKAYSLPDIKGRAIWKGGNKFIEIQTPFINDEEINHEIDAIKKGFESGKYKNLQPLLSFEDVLEQQEKGAFEDSVSNEES